MPVTASAFWIEELSPTKHGSPFIFRGHFSDVRIAIQVPKCSHVNSHTKNSIYSNFVSTNQETNNMSVNNGEKYAHLEPLKVKLVVIKRIHNALTPVTSDDSILDSRISQMRYKLTSSVISEVAALSTLTKRKNVISLLSLNETDLNDKSLSLVFPYHPLDLSEFIHSRRFHYDIHESRIQDPHIKSIIGDILMGLTHCHACNIVHNDIKPGNLLLTYEGLVQISDFGLSKGLHKPTSRLSTGLCTLHYRSPEHLYGSVDYNTTSSDIWACALVICELLILRPLFPGGSVLDQLSRIFDVLGTPDEKVWPGVTTLPDYKKIVFSKKVGVRLSRVIHRIKMNDDLNDLLNSMLCLNPSNRLQAQDCLRHSWFAKNPLPSHKEDVVRTLLGREWQPKDNLYIPKSYKDKELDSILTIAANIAARRRANFQDTVSKHIFNFKKSCPSIKDNRLL